ncbi:hypothetical protein [Peribacillus kribbensis]|uniref:hypothetical protein n=1 Tax=Peribacillus kribbensis TaxID=356658 RepID=UPI00041F3FE0|nr:hypothetical protein [Peribacillus kribbensis]
MKSNRFFDYWVARNSTDIFNCLRLSGSPISVEDLIIRVTGTQKLEYDFPLYCRAVETFLRANKDIGRDNQGRWFYKKAHLTSEPKVKEIDQSDIQATEKVHSISYTERVNGLMKVKLSILGIDGLTSPNIIEVVFDGCKYEFICSTVNGEDIVYGNGVMDFLSEASVIPGQKILFNYNNGINTLKVVPGENIGLAASDYDFKSIKEQLSQRNQYSDYTILYKLLSIYPEGLTLIEIYNYILDYKIVTMNDLKSLLKMNDCFVFDITQDKWTVRVDKIARYYVDASGNSTENELIYEWESRITFDHKVVTSDGTTKEHVEKVKEIEEGSERELSTVDILRMLDQSAVPYTQFQHEIERAVKEAFLAGDMNALLRGYQEADKIADYLSKFENLLRKWGESENNE